MSRHYNAGLAWSGILSAPVRGQRRAWSTGLARVTTKNRQNQQIITIYFFLKVFDKNSDACRTNVVDSVLDQPPEITFF
jgi:hypothetical protein